MATNMNLQHPERFWVDYIIDANSKEHASQIAREICLEQTVELPGTTQEVRSVEPYTVGTLERVEFLGDGSNNHPNHSKYRVSIAYPNDTAGDELPQFLNVVFGNTSLKRGVAVEDVTLSRHLMENSTMFPGPKFGIEGIRKILGVPQAPLLCTALKPMGKSSEDFANMAYALAKGGMDIIKDDHGLANQKWAPFEQRVALCCDAVQRANRETGRNCLYAPCLNAPSDQIISRAWYSKDMGAGAVMLLPGIAGFDAVRNLAADPNFNLPILIHPAMLGGWLKSSPHRDVTHRRGTCNSQEGHESEDYEEDPRGMSHKFLFGLLPRLCGGDIVIFCNSGGRFQFTSEECQSVTEGCRRPMGRFQPIFPSPAGGMKLDRIKEMRRAFGDDTVFLIGGNLLEQGSDLESDAKKFAHVAGRDRPYCLPRELSRMMSSTIVEEKVTSSKYMKENSSYIGDVVESDTAVHSIADVERVASNIRRRVLKYTLSNNGGYLSQACSSAETLATLYLRALRLGPSVALPVPGPFRGSPGPGLETITGEAYNGDPTDLTLDRLIFSPVHYAVVLYSLLVEVGRLDEKAFDSYNVDGSMVELIGAEHSPGHAVTAGSLAQALSQAAGIAYARKLKNATGRVAVFMSDGEFQEGQTWEAVQTMVNLKINVVIVVDVNGQQCDGEMKQVCNVGDLARKLRAFGAQVKQVDGHNVSEIEMAVRARSEVPSFVLCNTNPCQGIPLLNDRAPKLHYVRFRDTAEKRQFERVLVSMTDTVCRSDNKIGTTATQELSRVPFFAGKIRPAAEAPREEFSEVVRKVDVRVRPHREHLLDWMKLHPTSLVVTADLTSSCEADLIRDKLPQQYLSLGMAEQNMMSFCGGLARENFTPWIHTFGVFCTRRPFDQLAMSIGVPNLNVKILGFLPGLTTPGGVTHQAIDDVALCRSIPNIRVLEVGDATEVLSVLDVAQGIDGPVYIRMLRGEVPRLFPSYSPMKFGTVRVLSEGNDVCLVTTGICTEEAIKAREMIKLSGIHVLHLHLSTIVPFPVNVVLNAASSCKYGIITMENHLISGGVGSATAEVLADYAVGKRLIRLGVPNCYAHGASRDYLVSEYGFDKYSLIKAIEKLCHRQLSIVEQEETRKQKQVSVKEPIERPEDL